MLQALRQRREDDEQGFTLIELMVVVLIIAILLAIAIPTFLGAQNRAKDRAAQSDLRNSLTAAKTLATDQEGFFRTVDATGVFQPINAADMDLAETSLNHTDGVPTTDLISVDVTAVPVGQDVLLVKQTKASSNDFWGIKATKDGDVTYCRGDTNTSLTIANCTAASFAAAALIA